MTLGGGLAPAVARPVQTVGHQGNGGRIHQVNQALETKAVAARALPAKARGECLQVCQGGKEELARQRRVARAIGMGQAVAAGGFRSANGGQTRRHKAQGVAHVVEAERMSQLRVEQTDQVAPGRKGARLLGHPGLAGQLRHRVMGNKFTKLAQRGE